MAGWLERLTSSDKKSADKAKERLKLVLIHDRMDLTPDALEKMKNELLVVISHYVDIEPDLVNISMTQEGREQRLVADIPIRVTHRRR
ncbi:MAG TPA: cell division topological specificity factor MinE [Anaerolineaceae bacterium]|nr:cell division topological specificity factor MinE [Anaerolineaceae bacterium]